MGPRNVTDFINLLTNLINDGIIPILIGIAFLYFLWGLAQFTLIAGESEAARTSGRDKMIYGLAGLTVMTAVWGFVNIITSTFF